MENLWTDRTTLLLGDEKMKHLREAHVLIVGVGGVGAYAAEMLCRASVGELTIIDADIIHPTNINRQLPATQHTIGKLKVEVLAERFRDINPEIRIHAHAAYLNEQNIPQLLSPVQYPNGEVHNPYSFIVDAIDTIAPKCSLIVEAMNRNIPIVSSMGAGAKSDITQIRFADLWDTYHCGLAKAVRTRLKKAGIRCSLPVVFSTEQVNRHAIMTVDDEKNKKSTTGTISYMPATFGCFLAEYVIRKL